MEKPYRDVLCDVALRATEYLQLIQERPVRPSQQAIDDLMELGGPLPEHGQDARTVIKLLDEKGSPGTVATQGGRFFGSLLEGDWLVPFAPPCLVAVGSKTAAFVDFLLSLWNDDNLSC